MSKEREAFEKLPDINAILHNSEFGFNEGINQYYHPNHTEHRLSYAFLMGAWSAWQAKAQAVPESIGDIQSWIAVNSFSALDAVHDNVPIVDANELAKYIKSLDLSVSVPEVLKKFCNEHKDPAWRGRLTEYDKGYSDCCIAVLEMIEAQQPSSTSDCSDEP